MNRFGFLKNLKNPLIVMIGFIIIISLTSCSEPMLLEDNTEYSYSESSDNNRDYNWYKTQMNSGASSYTNCGPACVSMAVKYKQNIDVSVSDIRNIHYKNGGWWFSNDIKAALNQYGIGYKYLNLTSKRQLLASLSSGRILIVCLNMTFITKEQNDSESRENRFYDNVTGHFIILKGYSDGHEWFYSYDPNSWQNDFYSDNTPKGKDRSYSLDEVYYSMRRWNANYFEIL